MHFKNLKKKKKRSWQFPGGPVVRTSCFHCRRHSLISGQGTKIPKAAQCRKNKNQETFCPIKNKRVTSIYFLSVYFLHVYTYTHMHGALQKWGHITHTIFNNLFSFNIYGKHFFVTIHVFLHHLQYFKNIPWFNE